MRLSPSVPCQPTHHIEPASRGDYLVHRILDPCGRGEVHEERRFAGLRREEPRELAHSHSSALVVGAVAPEAL